MRAGWGRTARGRCGTASRRGSFIRVAGTAGQVRGPVLRASGRAKNLNSGERNESAAACPPPGQPSPSPQRCGLPACRARQRVRERSLRLPRLSPQCQPQSSGWQGPLGRGQQASLGLGALSMTAGLRNALQPRCSGRAQAGRQLGNGLAGQSGSLLRWRSGPSAVRQKGRPGLTESD